MEDEIEYRQRISVILIENGFGWVVDAVEIQIAEGKPITKQVSEVEAPFLEAQSFAIRQSKRRSSILVTSEPYTEGEKLDLLLSGVRSALVERAGLEEAIFENIPKFVEIEFQPDKLDDPGAVRESAGRRHILARERVPEAQSLRNRTLEVLMELEGVRHGD